MTTFYTKRGTAVHGSHRGMAEPVGAVIRHVLAAAPHKARLSDGLGLAFTSADENGRCKLMLSRPSRRRVVVGFREVDEVVYPGEEDVARVKGELEKLFDPAAFGTLKVSARAVVKGCGCVALFWYDIRVEGLL